jgi:hypothetical protein
MLTKMQVVSCVNHPIQIGRSFDLFCISPPNSYSYDKRTKIGVVPISPTLLVYMINLISPKPNVSISIIRGPETQMSLTDSDLIVRELFNGIMKLISNSVNANLSVSDANEILRRLELVDNVYLVKSDGSECLVVFENPNPNESHYKQEIFRRKLELFRNEVRVFNESRTVVMTPAQRDMILSAEMKPSVEFSSALPDGQFKIVFRRDAIQTVVPKIKKQVEIDNLRRRLEELMKSSSE